MRDIPDIAIVSADAQTPYRRSSKADAEGTAPPHLGRPLRKPSSQLRTTRRESDIFGTNHGRNADIMFMRWVLVYMACCFAWVSVLPVFRVVLQGTIWDSNCWR
jgi:hypothetical protein